MKKALALLAILPFMAAVPATAEAAPALKWTSPCPDYGMTPSPTAGLECAKLKVPLDYADPGGRAIELTLSRKASTSPKRRGVLLMNPGGPGSPGLAMPAQLARRQGQSGLLDSYDVIGFDPRGTTYSTPVTCDLTEEQRFILVGPYAEGPRDVAEKAAKSRVVAKQCAESKTADLLPQMTTANTARDMDRIREALGERKISYYGVSYGSYLGAAYASMFPTRTDRIVLDSLVGPDGLDVRAHQRFADGFDDRFGDFTAWAAARDDVYHLGRTQAEVTAKFFELVEERGSGIRSDTWGALYDDANFPTLAGKWAAPVASAQGGPLDGDNHAALQLQVLCNDSDWPESVRYYRKAVERARVTHPMFGPAAANITPCAFWPVERREPPVRIHDRGPSNILLVQNLRDPATPLVGAREMRSVLGARAKFVTVDAGGHGVFTKENACGNDAVVRYLRDGVLPAADAHCPA
ncbi:alpha/beta hydrolase [Amycolatopsis regifaucium]|uniref:Hydrolase n=1 Tax=Amycolatopsis regifaucium TaxID=546365 RepID=A0A154MN60_9PSEU|nr:alpha/beta hydrolase [Amycolatopsis regifaucium]KZB85721.1 hydrolase [Amycolatopsis regifaucium]OKA10524.1 hydrolase [Amycolatopsis regifaucium]SFI80776.1 Pimeloyl-ACP methyl ester carboxylesterase [Amycolatopsis regifaucium]